MTADRPCSHCGELLRPAMVRCRSCGIRRDIGFSSAGFQETRQASTPAPPAKRFHKPVNSVDVSEWLAVPIPFVQTRARGAASLPESKSISQNLADQAAAVIGRLVPDWAASFLPRSPATVGMVITILVVAGTAAFLTVSATAAPRIVLRGSISDVRFSPDSSRLLVTRSRGAAEIWNLKTMSIDHDVPVSTGGFGTFTADGQRAVFLMGGDAVAWNPSTQDRLSEASFMRICDPPMRSAAFPSDSSFGVCVGQTTSVAWDLETGQPIAKSKVSPIGRHGMNVDGTMFVESIGTAIRFGDPRTGEMDQFEVPLTEDLGRVRAVAVNPKGNRAALCLTSNRVMIVPLDTKGEKAVVIPARTGRTAIFGPGGQLWLAHSNRVTRLNLQARESKTVDLDDVDIIDRLAVSPDGLTICAGSSECGQVWLIEASTLHIRSVLSPPAASQ